jgi:hypothetical protein
MPFELVAIGKPEFAAEALLAVFVDDEGEAAWAGGCWMPGGVVRICTCDAVWK